MTDKPNEDQTAHGAGADGETDTIRTQVESDRPSNPPQTDSEKGQSSAGATNPTFSTMTWVFIIIGLWVSCFLCGLDTTITASIQGAVFESLGRIQLLPWIGTGFLLGSVTTILPFGSFYSKFEIKWVFIGSVLLFEAGSAICGAAPNMQALTVGRVIAGVGGAGIYLGALSYVVVFSSPAKAPLYTASLGAFWGLGAILGPVIGGAFASSSATWRWAFYINLCIAAVTAPIYIWSFPYSGAYSGKSLAERLIRIDWVGIILNTALYVLFIVACTFSGTTLPWKSASTICLWVFTGVAAILFSIQQGTSFLTTPDQRIFPVTLLKSRTQVLLFIATSCASAVAYLNVYYLPLFFQFTRDSSPIGSAIHLLPYICLFVLFNMLAGATLPVFKLYAAFYWAGGIFLVIATVLMYLTTSSTRESKIDGFQVLYGIGMGLSFQIGYSVSAVKAAPAQIPAAIGFLNVGQIGSGAIALAIAGNVFQNVGYIRLEHALAGHDFSSSAIHDALSGRESVLLSAQNTEIRSQAIDIIAGTITLCYSLAIAGAGLLTCAAILMRWEKLKMT